MSIFESIFKRKNRPTEPKVPKEPVVEMEPERTEGPELKLARIELEIADEMKLTREVEADILNSIGRNSDLFLEDGGGAIVVSKIELEFYKKVAEKLGNRPVVEIDINEDNDPSQTLLKLLERYGKDSKEKPIIFVKNYNRERLNTIDPRGKSHDFDGGLRNQKENEGWAVVLEGSGPEYYSGSLYATVKSTRLSAEESKRSDN